MLRQSGAVDDAERLAIELDLDTAFPPLAAAQRGVLASVALARGEAKHSLLLSDQGLDRCAAGCQRPDLLATLGLLRARSLHALSRYDEACASIRDARERVLALRDSIEEPALRDRYVEAFAETRDTLAFAKEWLGE